jgi:hypothetical protein
LKHDACIRTALGPIEAHLALLISMRGAMAALPTLITTAILAYFFIIETRPPNTISMEELRNYIAGRAPKWHQYYQINFDERRMIIEFCEMWVLIWADDDAVKKLAKYWCSEWTAFEQLDWAAILRRRNQTGHRFAGYPLVNHHFDVSPSLHQKGWYACDLLSHKVYVKPADATPTQIVLGPIEAYLADLTVRTAMITANLPVLIQREITYYFHN